jgi:GT2 family glycosyltransferase
MPIVWDKVEEWIFNKTIKALSQQTYPKKHIHVYLLATDRTVEDTLKGVTELMRQYVDTFTFIRNEGREGEQTRFPEIADARNQLLSFAKQHDYILFLDSDVVMPKGCIRKLLANQKDVCGATVKIPNNLGDAEFNFGYFTPLFSHGVVFATEKPVELRQVGFVNTACMLLSHKIINDSRVMFCCLTYNGDRQGSEDHSYCYLANLYGYKIYVDPAVNCKHYRRVNEATVDLMKA